MGRQMMLLSSESTQIVGESARPNMHCVDGKRGTVSQSVQEKEPEQTCLVGSISSNPSHACDIVCCGPGVIRALPLQTHTLSHFL